MEKNSFTSNFKNIPAAFCIFLLLAVCFETVNAAFDDYFYAPEVGTTAGFDSLRMKIKNEIAQLRENQFDVVILGDCYSIHGIRPDVIQKDAGLSAFNFATHHRHSLLASYALLRHYLNSASRSPHYVIIGFHPLTFASGRLIPAEISPVYRLGAAIELPNLVDAGYLYDFRDGNIDLIAKEFGIPAAIKFLLPSLKHQYFFQKAAKTFSLSFLQPSQVREFRAYVRQEGGFYRIPAYSTYSGSAVGSAHRLLPHFSVSDYSEHYLRKILDLTRQHHIPVLFVTASIPPDWYALWNESGFIGEYRLFTEALERQYANLRVIDPQPGVDQKIMYQDEIHLNQAGADALSRALALELMKNRSTSAEQRL